MMHFITALSKRFKWLWRPRQPYVTFVSRTLTSLLAPHVCGQFGVAAHASATHVQSLVSQIETDSCKYDGGTKLVGNGHGSDRPTEEDNLSRETADSLGYPPERPKDLATKTCYSWSLQLLRAGVAAGPTILDTAFTSCRIHGFLNRGGFHKPFRLPGRRLLSGSKVAAQVHLREENFEKVVVNYV